VKSLETVHGVLMDEKTAIEELAQRMNGDFRVLLEVDGEHLIERKRVRVDMMLRPKIELIGRGFPDQWFGIEVKVYGADWRGPKMRDHFWQCVTYAASTYRIDGEVVRPMFVLAYPVGADVRRDDLFSELRAFCQRGNVGSLEWDYRGRGWEICFPGRFFAQWKGPGKNNVGRKRVIGSKR
jgi:hypothetical protein